EEANRKNALSETSTKLASTVEKFEAAKKIVEGQEKRITSLESQITEDKKKLEFTETRFEACKKLTAASINKSKALVTENTEWKSKYEAACKIIQGMQIQMESVQKTGIHKVIAGEVSKFPEAMKATAKVA